MEANRVKRIHDFGQSIWLDFIDRHIIHSGELKKLIDEDGLRGVTSNPAIFEKAINGSTDYNDEIKILAHQQKSTEEIYQGIAISDIQNAADLFLQVYQEDATDGYVSLEVSPYLALDTEGTLKEARHLWHSVARKNVMIKIPGTLPGVPAIQQAIREGININVTLLFGLDRYRQVAEAYIAGLEERVKNDEPVDQIASVASFFLSRIDVMIDPMLDEKGLGNLKGEVAIASAKKAYQIYKELFGSERFKALEAKGANPQRLLWASTGTKNPEYSDVKYVEALIGPKTVNTVPMETLEAYRDHGNPASRLEQNPEGADQVLKQLKEGGIDLDQITQRLEEEGIEKFNKPYEKLLNAIEEQKKKAVTSFAL